MNIQRRRNRAAALAILLCLVGGPFATTLRAGAPAAAPTGARETAADPVKKAPYLLFPGTPGTMKVLWQLSATATSTIEWGTDPTCSAGRADNVEYGNDHQHAYTLAGLLPATRYHYRITTQGVAHTGSFLSPPAPDATRLEFLAYGDTRTYPDRHDQVAGAMLSAFAAGPALALCSGDMVEQGGSESAWTSDWFDPSYANVRRLTATVPYAACVGNHEMDPSPTLFGKYFPYPFAAGRYYSFDYGPAHFTVLDQYVAYDSTSAQGRWFRDDLARSGKPWKFVLLHEPGWSAAGEGHANNTTVQRHIEPFCERYGVAIVFAGHNHYYARAAVNGVQHVTTGGGGAPAKAPASGQSHVVARAPAYHYCQVAIDGGTLKFNARHGQTGAVLDSFTMTRSVTATLLASFAAEVHGEGVLLRWSFNAPVSRVDVERAESETGPWTLLPLEPQERDGVVEALDRGAEPGRDYWYRLDVTLTDASQATFGPVRAGLPATVTTSGLTRLAPNPSTGTTRIEYAVAARGRVRLSVVDVAGREVDVLLDQVVEPGRYTALWDGRRARGPLPAGLYFLRWESQGMDLQKRIVVLR